MGYSATSGSHNTWDDGYVNGTYVWSNVSVSVSIDSAGNLSWSAYSTNSLGSGGWVAIYLYLKIGSKVLYNGYYKTSGAFPASHDKSASGSFSIGDAASVDIVMGCTSGSSSSPGTSTVTIVRGVTQDWTSVGKPTLTITDNYNNTFTIHAKKGSSGTNNSANNLINLKWGYDTSYSNSYSGNVSSEVTATKTLTVSGTGSTRTVYAKATTDGSKNQATKEVSAAIKQYVGPYAPTGHKISYSKTKFTTRENWTLSWDASSTSNSCPVKGYRIRLYRKRGSGSFVKLPIYGSDGKYLSTKVVSSGDVYYDRDGTGTTLTIYPQYYSLDLHSDEPDIQAGDIIKFAVTAYTKYGKDFDGSATDSNGSALCFKTSEAFSSEYTLQNAGIARVKVDGTWKEGQVYVKVDGSWKEAVSVHTKVNGTWKESQ